MSADFGFLRERMVRDQLQARGIASAPVLEAFRRLPRQDFLPESTRPEAYEDRPVVIGENQTMSQPYMAAWMTQSLELRPGEKVLEVGTGCGYQTAVLSPLVRFVYSIERIGALLDRARVRFKELGIRNVHLRHGDGFQGWPAHGPYEAILMAAAPLAIPDVLFNQLAPGGRLIAPVGPEGRQQLMRITRRGEELHKESLGLVSFVPLLKGLG